MASKVLDSWALIAFFEDGQAAEAVEELLVQASQDRHRLYLSALSWAEIYYNTMREVSQGAADSRAAEIAILPIQIIGVSEDLKLARQAAHFRAIHRISIASAFAAMLAKDRKAELVTGDLELKNLDREIKICWIG